MIVGNHIQKSFGQLQVLREVNVHVQAGEIVSLLGKSGSGKSTLLHILGTLDRPDQGTILLDGVDVTTLKGKELSQFRNRHIGFIFQFHHLLPEFTALENTMMPGLIQGLSAAQSSKRAQELLDYLGLSERLQHKPAQMSGGEQQRVAVARALLNHPKVILADEPTGNLDSQNSEEMHRLFQQLRKDFGHTLLIATHSKELAASCDRRLEMVDGQVMLGA
ncbi:MAG: ABC transporter ATP-binding protein [Saprospiraceae bacterium]|nr:ABC transporter ATP-binding protein [Saprospiraceae bacterium]